MKKSLFLILGITLAVVFLILMGSVFQIGDKLGEIGGKWLEYGFYVLILVLLAIFVIVPVLKVHFAPEMPVLSTDGVIDIRKVEELGGKLAHNCSYISDDALRKEHREELSANLKAARGDLESLKELVNGEIAYRLEGDKSKDGAVMGINGKIREWARTVFLVTAISQNSKFDSLAVIAINYKMIEDIVLSSGFRPTRPQMMRLYIRVIATAMISYIASDALGDFSKDLMNSIPENPVLDVDMAEMSDRRFLDSIRRARIPSIIFGSALDGAINALLTLRIGYVTRACILKGAGVLNDRKGRRAVRLAAMREARRNIPAVIADSAGVIGKSAAGRLIRFFTHSSGEAAA